MPIDVLIAHRRHASLPPTGVAYRAESPALAFPDVDPPEDADARAEALGWSRPIPPGASVREVQPMGFVAPSPLERAWLAWVSRTLPVPLAAGWDTAIALPETALFARLAGVTPFAEAADVPGGVVVRRADTPRGEARAAAREIRKWAMEAAGRREDPAKVCAGVLVLLPSDPATSELWVRELERCDLPVSATTVEPLASTAIARWIGCVGRLAGWSASERRPRSLLAEVFLAPFWSATAVANGSVKKKIVEAPDDNDEVPPPPEDVRDELGSEPDASAPGAAPPADAKPPRPARYQIRRLLESLRRELVSTTEFADHVAAASKAIKDSEPDAARRREELQLVAELFMGVATALTGTWNLLARLRTLLSPGANEEPPVCLDVRCTLYQDEANKSAFFTCVAQLEALEREELAARGEHPSLASAALPSLITAAFAGKASVNHRMNATGVTLLPYATYDGRSCERLILAGLGEGQFPAAPATPSAREEKWIAALGFGDPKAWVCDEIERQITLASVAVARCTGAVTFSFAATDEAGSEVYPGALLSLLVGGWDEKAWARAASASPDKVRLESRGDEYPRSIAEAHCWEDARLFANDRESQLAAGARIEEGTAAPELAAMTATWRQLEATRVATAERQPAVNDSPLGAYSGILGGPVEVPPVWSATRLETYGQCGTKFFLDRVLGVKEHGDAGDEMDASEAGSFAHHVFELAAKAAIKDVGHWSLEAAPGEVDQTIARALAEVAPHIATALDEVHRGAPTFSRPLLGAIGARWKQAIRVWLTKHVREAVPIDLDSVDQATEVAEKVKAWEKAAAAVPAWKAQGSRLLELRAALAVKPDLKETPWKGYSEKGAITGAELGRQHANFAGGKNPAVLDDLDRMVVEGLPLARAWLPLAEAALVKAREVEIARRHAGVSRRVIAAEYSFGNDASGDADESLAVRVPTSGGSLLLHGEIDRIDGDPARGALTIRDYKSSKPQSVEKLTKSIAEGRHLQLILYAEAIRLLVEQGRGPGESGAKPRVVALEFPKAPGKESGSELTLDAPTEFTLDGSPASVAQLGLAWSGAHIAAISGGALPLFPAACPLENTGYCDHAEVCGFSAQHRPRFRPPEGQPAVAEILPAPKAPDDDKAKAPPTDLPPKGTVDVDADSARERHRQGSDLAGDVGRDVLLAAGAGTGKTWNLVRRYLAALAGDPARGIEPAEPENILCVTFTRKAAAEMAARVRSALLSPGPGQREPVALLKRDPARFRRIVLSLSSAPISTLDSLSARIVGEAAELKGQAAPPVEVVSDTAASAEINGLVSARFLDALQASDPVVAGLLNAVTVSKLRPALAKLVAARGPGIARSFTAPDIEALWSDWAQPMLDRAAAAAQEVKIEAGRAALAAAVKATPEARAEIAEALIALERVADDRASSAERWVRLHRVNEQGSANKGYLNDDALQKWLKDAQTAVLNAGGRDKSAGRAALVAWAKAHAIGSVPGWAATAAAALSLATTWRTDVMARFGSSGQLRYADIEAIATGVLTGADRDELRNRFPFTHVFIDEAQDTNEGQVELVRAVIALHDARQFWVGDGKQSIYRFRGAEVDVFDGLGGGDSLQVGTLAENRRSTPALLDAFNRVFSAMLPARNGGMKLDPGSEMPYEALTWPKEGGHAPHAGDTGVAPVELITTPGSRWLLDKTVATKTDGENGEAGETNSEENAEGGKKTGRGDDENPNSRNARTGGDNKPPTVLELATIARIGEIIVERESREQAPGPDGAHVAVLVHSWRRAVRYRELLARAGMVAVVQGGRGLLTTREVMSVLQWLRAAVNADNVGLVGALRGPGISLSDPALYCLRKGFGVRRPEGATWMPPVGPYSLRTTAIAGVLDPAAAVAAWPGLSDPERTRELLTRDAALLVKFQARWNSVTRALGRTPTHQVIEALLDEEGIRAHWHAGPAGRQAAANLDAFVDLVRMWEAANGTSPRALLRHLDQMTGQDDPASGGLDAGAGAPVLITTFWQAKGREWPVIVLPDLELTGVSDDATGFLPARLVRDGRTCHLPSALATNEKEPFQAEATAVHEMSKPERMAAARAELRRLFYVAATRAKERLVLSAKISAPDAGKASWANGEDDKSPKAESLDTANNWAALLRTTLALTFNKQGNPALGQGAWTAADIRLCAAAEREATVVAEARGVIGVPTPETWRAVPGTPVERYNPSSGAAGVVPPNLGGMAGWPTKVEKRAPVFRTMSQEGDAFHAMMEEWGYGLGGEPEAAARRALEREGLLPPRDGEDRVQRMLYLLDRCRSKQPQLFDDLAVAARDGRVYHEIPLTLFDENGRLINGVIDLLWRDAAGWHVLDYKSGSNHPTTETGVAYKGLRPYYHQTRTYGMAVARELGELPLVDFGVWYVDCGLVVRWGVA